MGLGSFRFRVWGLEFRVYGPATFEVQGFWGLRFGVSSSRLRLRVLRVGCLKVEWGSGPGFRFGSLGTVGVGCTLGL